jgi:hypothetical protein
VSVLENLDYPYASSSVNEIVYAKVFAYRLHFTNDKAWINKDNTDVVAQLIQEVDIDKETLLDTAQCLYKR